MPDNVFVRLMQRITTGKPIYRAILTPVGPLLFFGFIACLLYGATRMDAWLGLGTFIPPPWNVRLSRPFMLCGLALMAWSASRFFQAKGTPVPFNPPRRLVTTGPYAWSRNPMMSGLFIVLFGVGIRLVSVSLLLFFLPLFMLLVGIMLKKVEEPGLERRFQEEYRRYKETTPMFLPWRRAGKGQRRGRPPGRG